jgi:MFS family permease
MSKKFLWNPFLPRNVPLIGILLAYAASITGNMMASIALPWFVLELTGDAAQTGIVAFASILPLMLGTFFGGVYVDRVGRRQASIVADLISGISVAAIPVLSGSIGIQFWHLLVLTFIGALLDASGITARESLLPEVARLARVPLSRLNAVTETVQATSLLIGPAIAGFLIATLGSVNMLWFTAALSLIAAIASLGLIPKRLGRVAANLHSNYFELLQEGIRFIAQDSIIKWLIGLFTSLTLITW